MEPFEDEDPDVVVMGVDWSKPEGDEEEKPAKRVKLAPLPAPKPPGEPVGEPAQAKEALEAKAGKPKKKPRKRKPAAEDSETESDEAHKPAAEASDKKEKKPKKKRKANPAAEDSKDKASDDPEFMEKLRIELETARVIYLQLTGKPVQQLLETGVGWAPMPPEEQKGLEQCLAVVSGLLTASFKLPPHVKDDLEKGSARAFYKHWGEMPSGKDKPVLYAFGMPQTAIQTPEEQMNNTDKYGSVYTETPASQLSMAAWEPPWMERLGLELQHAQLERLFPDDMKQIKRELSEIDPEGADEEGEKKRWTITKRLAVLEKQGRSQTGGDGGKFMIPKHSKDGMVKGLTVVHVDQPFDAAATGDFKDIGTGMRIQAVLCASTEETRIVATPLTPEGLALLDQKFKGRGGFQSMEHDKKLVDLVKEFAVGPEPGDVGTLLWTKVPHGEIASGLTKSNKGTFRIYCGKKWLPKGFPVERLIDHAFMRWFGYEFDPFAIGANKYNPLFVNGKSCQGHTERRGPIPDIRVLLDLPLEEKKKVLRDEASDFFLMHNGLTRDDLKRTEPIF